MNGLSQDVGLAVTLAVMTALRAVIRLQTVTLLDIGSCAIGLSLVAAATALAAFQPASRATRLDPSVTLRTDGY